MLPIAMICELWVIVLYYYRLRYACPNLIRCYNWKVAFFKTWNKNYINNEQLKVCDL